MGMVLLGRTVSSWDDPPTEPTEVGGKGGINLTCRSSRQRLRSWRTLGSSANSRAHPALGTENSYIKACAVDEARRHQPHRHHASALARRSVQIMSCSTYKNAERRFPPPLGTHCYWRRPECAR